MYKNLYFDRANNEIHLWTDGEHGDKPYEKFKYEKYAYKFDPNGQHRTLNDLPVTKVKRWSREDEEAGLIFEHDVPASTRVLIDRYQQYEEPSKGHVVLYFDIEVERGQKYSKPAQALNVINAVSFYDTHTKLYRCYLLDREANLHDRTLDDGTVFKRFTTEQDLLLGFLETWRKINSSIITGWNSAFFDVPYLYNRLKNVFDEETANLLSPIGVVNAREYNGEFETTIAGVVSMDYLQLYKKFTYSEESSYKLEAIAQKELKRGKVQYQGTLDDFYKTDINGFIKYNVTDVELVVAIDAKRNLLDIARGICHAGFVPYDDFLFSSKYLDGASLAYCKRNNLVAIRLKSSGPATTAEGALVKEPKRGIYEYVIDEDLTSLYPSLIRTLNISPETLYGKVLNWNEDDYEANVEKTYNIELYSRQSQIIKIQSSEFLKYLTTENLSIASNGVLFKMDKIGLIPAILTQWFNERKRLSKLAEEFALSGDDVQYKYYDQKQLIQKILLNSFYGVLLLPSFRFYNKQIGESVTLTGQSVIKFSIKMANLYCNSKLKTNGVDYVLAGDTDSLFLSALPLIKMRYDGTDEDTMVKHTLEIASELQTLINKTYDYYAFKLHNVTTHFLNIKQEVIARRAFWGQAKKRYAMQIINKKGVPVNELDIKGFDTVRSNFPKSFRAMMRNLFISILNDKTPTQLQTEIRTFKSKYNKMPIFEIMVPTGVKEISKYTIGQKGTPIHIKSAQNYNSLLNVFNLGGYAPIDDGDKILYAYLKQNPFGFETMAVNGYDDPVELIDFVEKYIDRDKIFKQVLFGKLEQLWDDLGFGKLDRDTNDVLF
jgi:DNA polymerase elongation subunit (family B)